MPRGKSRADTYSLAMDLVGYELQKQKIEEKIREIKSQLSGKGSAQAGGGSKDQPGTRKRVLSAGARKRIAAAQRRRWAEHRKKNATAAKSE